MSYVQVFILAFIWPSLLHLFFDSFSVAVNVAIYDVKLNANSY